MSVTELIDSFPIGNTVRRIQRNEALLFTKPDPGRMKLWRDYDLLRGISFPTKYIPSKFAPPVDVFQNDHLRVEWMKMDFRQPFYHRNSDVDEISYHIIGKRTLMTEKGSVALDTGDFARIPVAVGHDNHGVEEVHLIFYIVGPVAECVPPTRTASCTIPPFPGWEANPAITEVMTECLGAAVGCDCAVSLTDEKMLLETAKADPDPITVLRASTGSTETQWLYKSTHVWLGSTTLTSSSGDIYRRHHSAEEIQCQVKGRRTLVTQRGTIELEAGDLVSIPLGTAFTDIVREESVHVSVLTRYPAKPKGEHSKVASATSIENVRNLRKG